MDWGLFVYNYFFFIEIKSNKEDTYVKYIV